MAHVWDIIENPEGEFIIRKVVKRDDAVAVQHGPFRDRPAAEKGLKRAIDPPTYPYDEKGNAIT